MVSRYTTLVPSMGLHIGPACEAGLSANMQRKCVLPHRRKKKGKEDTVTNSAGLRYHKHCN